MTWRELAHRILTEFDDEQIATDVTITDKGGEEDVEFYTAKLVFNNLEIETCSLDVGHPVLTFDK